MIASTRPSSATVQPGSDSSTKTGIENNERTAAFPFFCVMASPARVAAGECLGLLPYRRAKRGAHFCSTECHREYRRIRRQELAGRKCRLCGRTPRPPKQLGRVRSAHKGLFDALPSADNGEI